MLSQGVWNEDTQKWDRSDKKECCQCGNTFSTSPELFLVKFADKEELIYCNVCLGEGPLSNGLNKIESMTKVELNFIKIGSQDLESLNAVKKTLEKIAKTPTARISWENSDYSDIICFLSNLAHTRFERSYGLNMYQVLKDAKSSELRTKEPEHVEIDIWTDKIDRFRTEFLSMNDVKFDDSEVTAQQGVDKRYTILYRNFGSELNFPEQGYYQLKNVFRNVGGK